MEELLSKEPPSLALISSCFEVTVGSFILDVCMYVYILGPHLWHVGVPELGVTLELQLWLMPQPQLHQI